MERKRGREKGEARDRMPFLMSRVGGEEESLIWAEWIFMLITIRGRAFPRIPFSGWFLASHIPHLNRNGNRNFMRTRLVNGHAPFPVWSSDDHMCLVMLNSWFDQAMIFCDRSRQIQASIKQWIDALVHGLSQYCTRYDYHINCNHNSTTTQSFMKSFFFVSKRAQEMITCAW